MLTPTPPLPPPERDDSASPLLDAGQPAPLRRGPGRRARLAPVLVLGLLATLVGAGMVLAGAGPSVEATGTPTLDSAVASSTETDPLTSTVARLGQR